MGNKKERRFLLTGCDEHDKNEVISVCEMIVGRPLIWKFRKIFKKTFKRLRRIKYRVDRNNPTTFEFTVKCHAADWNLIRKVLKMNYSTQVAFV